MTHNKMLASFLTEVTARQLEQTIGVVYEIQNKELGFGFLNLSTFT